MHRWAVLVALVGCEPTKERLAEPPRWVYPPSASAWPIGASVGTIGRDQAPQITSRIGVPGELEPLRLPTVWQMPGDGPARAAVYGTVHGKNAVELIEIDAGRIAWRDTKVCAGPIVGVTEESIVCSDVDGIRAVGIDGKQRWKFEATFIAMTEGRVIAAGAGESIIVDADLGDELARVKLPSLPPPKLKSPVTGKLKKPAPPEPISSSEIVAACGDAGRELFAFGIASQLVRIASGPGGPKVAWMVPLPAVAGLDACDGSTILVTSTTARGTALIALSRETGKQTGMIEGVNGYWPARDGSARIEVSAQGAVTRWSRDLVEREPVDVPVLHELLAKRGDRRLVRATDTTAVLLDSNGVAGYLPLAKLSAALGDRAIVAGSWLGRAGESVLQVAIPPRYRRALRVPAARGPVALAAELRDLPAPVAPDPTAVFEKPDVGKVPVYFPIALDPVDAAVYVAALDVDGGGASVPTIARFDLRKRTWVWQRSGGCGPRPVDVAIARDVVVCGGRDDKHAAVIATTRDGNPAWQWNGDNVDAVQAGGDIVVVHDGDRAFVLDALDGHVLGMFASDDGAPFRAAIVDIAGMTVLVTAEANRVLGRLPRVRMVPAWTLAVAGVVHSLSAAGDGVVVDLEGGDAYRIDGRAGTFVALPELGLEWRGFTDLVTGEAPGGPIPPATMPTLPPLPKAKGPAPERDPMEDAPLLPRTWRIPPDLAASYQLVLYEHSGAIRARNDYALTAPVTPVLARQSGAPFVVQSGPGRRDVLVIDPERGDPLRRLQLPDDAADAGTFSTIVDGKPVVGMVVANPLRVVLF